MNIITIKNIRAYEDENKIIHLGLKEIAENLGFTETRWNNTLKADIEYIMWKRIFKYLHEFGIETDNKDSFIPENVFYKLCMKANNKIARKFQDLVCDEILPSIRKNGGYIVTNENDTDADIMARALLIAKKTIDKKNLEIEKNKEIIAEQATKILEDYPKVIFADAVSTAKTSILIGELAKIIKQNGVDMGQQRLFNWLRDNQYLVKRQGSDYNMPTQKSMNLGLFEIKETAITHSDGHISISKTVKVTGKGQLYLTNKFIK